MTLPLESPSDLSRRSSRFLWTPLPRGGAPRWGIPRFRVLDPFRPQAHINTLELKVVILALHHWVSVLQGHQLMMVTDNSTVVAYINKQGGWDPFPWTHSHTLLRLVVDLFLWLQTQDVAIQARHIPGCLNVIGLADRLIRPNQLITTE